MTGIRFTVCTLVLDPGLAGQRGESRGLVESNVLSESNLVARFVERARICSDKPAISTATLNWTYEEIVAAASEIAVTIQSCPRFSSGCRVILLLPNSAEYVAAFYGTLLAGGVVVPLPPTVEDQAFERICDSTEAISVIAPSVARRLPSALNKTLRRNVPLKGHAAADHVIPLSIPDSQGNDLAAIFFTSGSTGDPKGVMLSHQNLIQNAASIQQYLEIRESDRPLCVLPFFHAFGNSVLQSHLLAGATLILDGKTLFPETLIDAITRHEATSLSGVPDLFRLLLERTSLGKTQLPSLRYMAVAGGALPHDLAVKMAHRIAPARYFVMYGQTEATARVAFVPPEHLTDLAAGCIGRAIPGVELDVVDEQGRRIAPGETGELRAFGLNVMLGYWNDSEATLDRIREGWLYTGDLVTTDDDGWFYHRGRRNAIVKIAGFRVHPGDLEEFAMRRLSVDQAVAVPFDQPPVGIRLALFIRRTEANELTLAEMMERCRAELPRHLAPSHIRQIDDFPLNSAMKIDRIRLSQIAGQHAPGTLQHLDLHQSAVKGGCP